MAFSNFRHRINWRLMVVHLVATIFIALGASQFANLSVMDIIQTFIDFGYYDGMERLTREDDFEMRLFNYLIWTSLSALIGVVISFGVSLAINIKKRVFWFNSLIVFVVSVVLHRIGFFSFDIIEEVFFALGNLVVRFGIEYKFILNGIVLTVVGLYVFFSKWTNTYAFKVRSKSKEVFPIDNEG